MHSFTRLAGRFATALLLAGLIAGCGDDDPSAPRNVDLSEVEGLYLTGTLTFDPQGSAPAADVLAALEEAGTSPTLNIGRTGGFQLFYRDPVSGNITTLGGSVEASAEGVALVFTSQQQADQFLFPRRLPLEWDADAEVLSFSGATEVSRTRLQQLFPELYAEEQLFDPTPGTLTVRFERGREI